MSINKYSDLTCLLICKLKSLHIYLETYNLLYFDANDLLKIWPTIFFFKMRNVRPCKYSRTWLTFILYISNFLYLSPINFSSSTNFSSLYLHPSWKFNHIDRVWSSSATRETTHLLRHQIWSLTFLVVWFLY